MRATGAVGGWRSERARRRFTRAYERAMALWPGSPHAVDLATAHGSTRVYRTGPDGPDGPDGPGLPVVLLHGAEANAAAMYPFVAPLAGRHRVIAPDVPGHPGASEELRPVHPPASQAAWLAEVLDLLGVARAHLVGHSYGGWVALNQAHRLPDRVASVVAIDPGGIEATSARFVALLYLNAVAGLLPEALRRRAAVRLDNPVLAVPRLRAMLLAGVRGYRPRRPSPAPLTDAELAAIVAPVLVLVGARSPLLHPERAARRVRRHVAGGEAVVLPGVGHGPGFDGGDRVARLVTDHLDRAERHRRSAQEPTP